MNRRRFSVAHSSDVPAGPAEAWTVVADPARRPEWMTELARVDAAPGLLHVGDRFTGKSSILLHDFIGASEVKVADPGRSLVEEVVIGARFTSHWALAVAAGGGTTVNHTIDIDFPAGPFSPIERWVLRRRLSRMQKVSLGKLRRMLEG